MLNWKECLPFFQDLKVFKAIISHTEGRHQTFKGLEVGETQIVGRKQDSAPIRAPRHTGPWPVLTQLGRLRPAPGDAGL